MTHDEARQCVKFLGGLYPGQITQDQAKVAADEFRPFDAGAVRAAIQQYRSAHDVIEWTVLFAAVARPVAVPGDAGTTDAQQGTVLAVARRLRPDLAERSDTEVILRYFRADWVRFAARYAERAKDKASWDQQRGEVTRDLARIGWDGKRQSVVTSCVGALLGIGMTYDDARGWAETCFAPVEEFKNVLADLRGELPGFAGSPVEGDEVEVPAVF